MIWIRADANREIGTGHVMRCLSIAAQLRREGQQVCFLTADEDALPLLQAKGQEYLVLHSDYRKPEGELERLKELFQGKGPGFFLADSYFVTPAYFRRIREWVPTGYMDDRCVGNFPLDMLINYNIFAESSLYEGQEGTRLLLGPEYAPLREEFAGTAYQVRECALRVLVTTGGSDRYNLAGRLLEKALAEPETARLEYSVVSGAYNVHLDCLRKMEAGHPNVRIHSNVSRMEELMQKSDIAVTAGGSTMYELSAVGVPMICFSFVDNQEHIVEGFVKKGLVCFGGNYLVQGEEMLDRVVENIAKLASGEELRRDYSMRLRRIADGQGARRIAREIREMARREV